MTDTTQKWVVFSNTKKAGEIFGSEKSRGAYRTGWRKKF